jgi:MFS family permease
MLQLQRYQQIFRFRAFRFFWIGFTLSTLGDVAARVALTWFVFEKTNSSQALGLLALAYTGPIVLSGLFVGSILDRFDRRKVMMLDNLIRGTVMLLIPLLHILELLALWHIYLAAFIFGTFVMFSLAGSPALVPDLVDEEHLSTANALETLSYTLSSVLGPLFAGLLLPLTGAAFVILLDALSYFVFAVLLWKMPSVRKTQDETLDNKEQVLTSYRLADAGKLLLRNHILLSTTLMFMAVNLGFGAFLVWLPFLASDILNGGSELYGALLGALALGELISSILVGVVDIPISLGKLIALAQFFSGLALSILLLSISIPLAFLSLFLFGFVSAPLTIWAQTLRMKIIPSDLRGRTFALLRMLMQSTNPAGGMIGGFILPLLSIPLMLIVCAATIGIPGLLGLQVRQLREVR